MARRLIYRSLVWAPRFIQQNSITAQTGTYTVTGVAAGLHKALHIISSAGTYVLTGVAATLFKNITLIATRGTYVLTGVASVLARKIASLLFIRNVAASLRRLRASLSTLSK